MTTEKKSGKQATKGQKQIVEENAKTLNFYRNMMITGFMTTLTCWFLLFIRIHTFDIVLTTLSVFIQFCCYRFMVYMARAKYTETGQLIDGGVDLNMESGISEHIKDTIILITILQLRTRKVSNHFCLLLLLQPITVLWIIRVKIKHNAFSQEMAVESIVDKTGSVLEGEQKRKFSRNTDLAS
uniref:Transmembrane protein 208 n=1 Tax=Scapholeberis mucronata TaxID=202097 RepID=A0A4Y7NL61_9CRUS|nr:EOG090X0IGL [Scapholeberis mucronata]SVE93990.1 EOG090X0IGL [Scapholeberis mucronata]